MFFEYLVSTDLSRARRDFSFLQGSHILMLTGIIQEPEMVKMGQESILRTIIGVVGSVLRTWRQLVLFEGGSYYSAPFTVAF